MASLKDMRVRIAATKATQKITKAMQMVAASKLRRAQVAAEAARPYAERMTKVLGSIAAAVAGSDAAPRLLAGTGNDKVHLLVVCTAERGLCGAVQFVDRAAGARADQCADEPGQGRQNSLRRPQGCRPAAPGLRQSRSSRPSSCAASSRSASSRPRWLPTRSSRCSTKARSTSARCSSRASAR